MPTPFLGHAHFRSAVFPQYAGLFDTLSRGQQPPVCLITCSDSRIMPEMILQAVPGEIFTIRNAGNLVPEWGEAHSGVAASVEYAVAALGVRHLVVSGHSGCGAIKEVLERKHTATLPAVTAWLNHAGPSSRWLANMLRDTVGVSDDHKLRLLIEANVITQVSRLRAYPVVASAIAEGKLELHGWVYDIPSGEIRSLDHAAGNFAPVDLAWIDRAHQMSEQRIA